MKVVHTRRPYLHIDIRFTLGPAHDTQAVWRSPQADT